MYGETGEPKDGNTKIAGQGHCRTENMECGKELDMQNETDKQILSTLNQDNFQNSSGGKKAAEDDEMGLFSQGFMDRMREMVSEQFGEEAAERFMVQNKDMIKNKLSEIMGRRRLNMAEVARLAGLTHVTVFRIYHDKTKTIELETLNKLCNALNCRVQDIFEHIPD